MGAVGVRETSRKERKHRGGGKFEFIGEKRCVCGLCYECKGVESGCTKATETVEMRQVEDRGETSTRTTFFATPVTKMTTGATRLSCRLSQKAWKSPLVCPRGGRSDARLATGVAAVSSRQHRPSPLRTT
ncbi:hypothetical protein TGP89_207065 [Toxoplasma gondii p89]|uniref:Uncharacterized protein n=1 Tax=Toxoplasma gondii p89 TaxID=943119 RepID=A0A086J6V3_TOXGO|nr:hypothetical protein TGP89_207065 [Toxoplasma gondii p89]